MTNGPYRRNDKLEYQECTCKMDKSLNRGMFNKFESRKISVAGYQCDNSDFHFCISEHKELPVIKSVPMKEETIVASTIEAKRDWGFFWNYCDNCYNSFYYFNVV